MTQTARQRQVLKRARLTTRRLRGKLRQKSAALRQYDASVRDAEAYRTGYAAAEEAAAAAAEGEEVPPAPTRNELDPWAGYDLPEVNGPGNPRITDVERIEPEAEDDGGVPPLAWLALLALLGLWAWKRKGKGKR